MSHVHADSMMKYAQDAAVHDSPWENWQYSNGGSIWTNCASHPKWDIGIEYRQIPKKTVFEQLVAPVTNADDINLYQPYFIVDVKTLYIDERCNYNPNMLRNHMMDYHVYVDLEDAQNAVKFLKLFQK